MIINMGTLNGKITIDGYVISKLAGITTTECYGIVGMASKNMKDGIVRLLKMENITKGVKLNFSENSFTIDLHIIVKYGINIDAVCKTIINTVKYKIEKYTDIKVDNITIFVEDIKVID